MESSVLNERMEGMEEVQEEHHVHHHFRCKHARPPCLVPGCGLMHRSAQRSLVCAPLDALRAGRSSM